MKKIFLTLILSLILSVNVNAKDKYEEALNEWFLLNNHTQYIEVNKDYDECKNCTRWDAGPRCFEEVGKPKKQCVLDGDQSYGEDGYKWADHKKYKNKLKIKFFKKKDGKIRHSIPWNAKNINDDTLLYYGFVRSKKADLSNDKYLIEASSNPYEFEFDLREDKNVDKELKKSPIMSYLLFENGKITVDKKSPDDRFGILVHDGAKFLSSSVGKTMVSYMLGHAVCGGYIDSVESKIDDYPLLKNTVYDGQRIIDLLNMASGDQKYVTLEKRIKKTGKMAGFAPIRYHMEGVFKGSEKSKKKYNYNGFPPIILINYIWYKSNGDYQKILDKTFREKSKIKNYAIFSKHKDGTYDDGILTNQFWATRYDYMRIAKAMLDDWQNDTCVGKYLKNIYKNRIKKNHSYKNDKNSFLNPKGYAGFFHTDYSGMKDRTIMGMDGNGGQSIMIDFDRGRIIVINSIHTTYNWTKIAHSVIKNGS